MFVRNIFLLLVVHLHFLFWGEFSGGPVVRAPGFRCQGPEFNPWSSKQSPISHVVYTVCVYICVCVSFFNPSPHMHTLVFFLVKFTKPLGVLFFIERLHPLMHRHLSVALTLTPSRPSAAHLNLWAASVSKLE